MRDGRRPLSDTAVDVLDAFSLRGERYCVWVVVPSAETMCVAIPRWTGIISGGSYRAFLVGRFFFEVMIEGKDYGVEEWKRINHTGSKFTNSKVILWPVEAMTGEIAFLFRLQAT